MDNKARTLNIAYTHVQQATANPEYGLALAFNVIIKSYSVSSVIRNATYRNLRQSLHISNDNLRQAVNAGIKYGLITKFKKTNKQGKTISYIRALPIKETDEAGKQWRMNMRFKVCNSKAGERSKQVYLASKTKDNYIKYSQLTSWLSLSHVNDLFMIVVLDKLQKGYWKGRDQVCKRKIGSTLSKRFGSSKLIRALENDLIDKSKVDDYNWTNTGYSYATMAKRIGGNISVYQISKLIHKAVDDGIFKIFKNKLCVRNDRLIDRYWDCDFGIAKPTMSNPISYWEYVYKQEAAIKAHKDDFEDKGAYWNPYTNKWENLDKRGFHGKKTTVRYKLQRVIKRIKDKDGNWVKKPNTDPNNPEPYEYSEKKIRTYTHEDRFKIFKRMANSYQRCGDIEGKCYSKARYEKANKIRKKIRRCKSVK